MSKARKISSFGKTDADKNPYENREGLVYRRVSSKRQESEGHGLESQEQRCKDYLKTIKIPYTKTFSDSASGGGDFMKRNAMREMLEYIDKNPHKKFMVVFDDLKRFARDVEFHLKLRTALQSRDVIPKCLNYNFDESPEGRFAELIMAGQAELERHQNTRQVVQKQRARLMLGYWAFGSKRAYKMTPDPVHGTISLPLEPDATILREALEGYAKGLFVRKVDACRFLVDKGFWKNQSPEKYIDKFSGILRDPFYAGFIEYLSWDVEKRVGKHKGIITVEIFELNQKRLKNEDTGKRIRVDISPEFPLRGLISCSACEGHLTAGNSKGRLRSYAYYICHAKSCSFYGKSLNKKDVEDRFKAYLKKHKLKSKVDPLINIIFERAWNEEITHYEANVEQRMKEIYIIDKKIKQLSDRAINAKSEALVVVYEKQIEESLEQKSKIDIRRVSSIDWDIPYRTALDKSTILLKNPYKIWVQLDVFEQQRLFFFIFNEKLPYSKKEGYRTDKIPCAVTLFEDFVTSNTQDVEMAGIEPACRKDS